MAGILNFMSGQGHSPTRATRKRGGSSAGDEHAPEGSEPDETSILDEKEGSIIMSLISQLRIGMDLQKVAFPTFVLEPRSMLERITDFMSHPDLIFGAENEPNAEDRFLRILRYYLSGWHNKPKGVKKPYNPILGEFFRCRFEYKDGSSGFYIAEQVSHHPPISAYFYVSPANKLIIAGELRPKSKFLGNSVSTVMEGENRVTLMGKPEDGEYVISMPNMYARGILFGKMVLELGDTSVARCTKTGMSCEVVFKTKGMFSGTYNAVQGKVKKDNTEIGEITGTWSHNMRYKGTKASEAKSFFDVAAEGRNMATKHVLPEEEQEPNESGRLWARLTSAIDAKDMDAATAAKVEVEDAQREEAKRREERGEKYVPRFFEFRDGLWVARIVLPTDPQDQIAAVQKWLWPGSHPASDPLPPSPTSTSSATGPAATS